MPLLSALAVRAADRLIDSKRQMRGKRRLLGFLIRLSPGSFIRSRYGVRLRTRPGDLTGVYALLGNPSYDEVAGVVGRLSAGSCFIDVGANLGLFSILASRRVGRDGLVLAFEPGASVFADLVANTAANRAVNVVPFMMALGADTGLIGFSTGDGSHSGSQHVSEGSAERVLMVDVTRDLEAVVKVVGDRRCTIKIDVEGYEFPALKALRGVFDRGLVDLIVAEIVPDRMRAYGYSVEELYAWLAGYGLEPAGRAEREPQYDEVFTRSPDAARPRAQAA